MLQGQKSLLFLFVLPLESCECGYKSLQLSQWKTSHLFVLCAWISTRHMWISIGIPPPTHPPKITTVAKTSGSFPGLPLCSLGIMKDAWDRLRQCISPTTSMPHSSNNTLPILNQAFQFVCGGVAQVSPSTPTLPSGQMCSLADPKAITFAIMQQQQRAEVYISLVFVCLCVLTF